MLRRLNGRPTRVAKFAMAAVLAAALPAAAQGIAKGVVKDDKGQPVEGAKVTIDMVGGTGRKFETKTDKKGEFLQMLLGSRALVWAKGHEPSSFWGGQHFFHNRWATLSPNTSLTASIAFVVGSN